MTDATETATTTATTPTKKSTTAAEFVLCVFVILLTTGGFSLILTTPPAKWFETAGAWLQGAEDSLMSRYHGGLIASKEERCAAMFSHAMQTGNGDDITRFYRYCSP